MRFLVIAALTLMSCAAWSADTSELAKQVRAAEQAFADSMAKRDLNAFATLLADDAVFFGRETLRGKRAVVTGWQSFFEGDAAPFSWKPESVEVLDSGDLAHSSGPIFDAQGNQVATFNSVWRREANGDWKVIFDKGCERCACEPRRP